MKHLLSKTALLGAAALLSAAPRARAQSADQKWGLSGYVTALQYRGDLGSNFWDLSTSNIGGGIALSRYISRGFDLSLTANQNLLSFPDNTTTNFTSGGQRFRANVTTLGLGLKFKMPFKDEAVVKPYILLQPGWSYIYSYRYATPTATNNQLTFGAFDAQAALGLDFRLGPGAKFFIQAGQHLLFRPDYMLDGVAGRGADPSGIWDKYDRYMQFSTGFTVNFGKPKDTDGDGVPDRKDKCPDTPAGVKVDANGCPFDSDGDGIPDYQDKCPDQKGTAALQGCPDADGDGVADGDDKCPNTPAGVKVDATGCPVDSDGDGVGDYLDKCPNTPSGVKVDANGCPVDSDGDGVPDYQDKCPNQAGPASNQGCPEIKAEDRKILEEATKYINFDFNKATLKPSSFPRLNEMVRILNEYPDYSLSIAGHTDSKGDDSYNLRLSYERAASAKAYMLSKGIPASRIEARGYGETKPVADNKTAAGQALNRRVDFDPYLTGTPNAAEVKYGPAPTIAELNAAGKPLPGTPAKGKAAPAKRKAAPARRAPARRR